MTDSTEISETLPALLDEERLRRFCTKIGLTQAPIFDPPEIFGGHPTDRIAATWLLVGLYLAVTPRKPEKPRRRRGAPRKIRTRGLLCSNDKDEQRAMQVDLIRQKTDANLSDAEIIDDLMKSGPLSRSLDGLFKRLAGFKNGSKSGLVSSVSRGRRKLDLARR